MVAIVTGTGVGIERSSASVLGARGQIGSATVGRGGDNAYLNAATGNLVITRQDEFLIGVGPDISIGRTYNSQALLPDGDNGDNWRASAYRRIIGVVGTPTVMRVDWDGTETLFHQVVGNPNLYRTTEGSGAPDEVWWNPTTTQWMFRDTNSRIRDYYDITGKLLTTTDLDFNTLTYSYVGALLSSVTDQNGERTDFVYGGTGGLQLLEIATQAPTGSVRVRYGYDSLNRLKTVTVDLTPGDGSVADGNAYVTTYGYDGLSKRVSSIAQSDGSLLEIGYTSDGIQHRVTSLTETVADQVTRVTGIHYDPIARTTRITDPLGLVTTVGYDLKGNLTQVAFGPPQAPTSVTTYTYGPTGDVLSMTENGRRTDYEYDSQGNQTLSRDSAGNTVTRTYGARNEVVTSTLYLTPDPDGPGNGAGTPVTTRYAHDGENHRRFAVSAEGDVVEYLYNAPGQLVATIEYTTHKYDVSALAPNAVLTEATLAAWAAGIGDKSNVRRTDTTYDFRGNVQTVTRYSATDSAGNGLLSADYSRETYVYDQAGQLLNRANSSSSAQEVFTYDGLGRIKSATDMANAATTFLYSDSVSTTTTTTTTLPSGLVRVSSYNKAGELISVTEAAPGASDAVTNYHYDGLGRLRMQTSATGLATYHLYDNSSRKVADITADGSMTEYAYDSNDRLVKTVGYINKLSASQIAQLDDFTAGGAGGAATGAQGIAGAPSGLNLIVNGGFDSSAPGGYTVLPDDGRSNPTLPGWIKINSEAYEQVSSGVGGVTASEGQFWLDMDSVPGSGNRFTTGSNLVLNSSFEDSAASFTSYFWGRSSTTLPDWAKANAEQFEQVATGNYGVAASHGSYWLDLDSIPSVRSTIGNNLLLNPSFDTIEAGAAATGTGYSSSTLTGWTKANSEKFEQVQSGALGVTASNGGYWLDLESVAGTGTYLATGSNLLTNGSFDTSAGAYTTLPSGRSHPTLPGWSKTNTENFEQSPSGWQGITGTDGGFWLDLDSVPSVDVPYGASLLVNGSFDQSAATYTTTSTGRASDTLPGWTNLSTYQFEQVAAGQMGVTGTDGAYWLDLDSVPITATPANLIVNGSFEQSGASYTTTATGRMNGSIPGWTGAFFEQTNSGTNGVAASDGTFFLDSDSGSANMDISQTVANMTAGAHTLKFDFANLAGFVGDEWDSSGSLEVYWNGALLGYVGSTDSALTTKTFTVNAVQGNNTVRFKETGIRDGVGVYLDNVRLTSNTTVAGGNMNISQTVAGLTAGERLQFSFNFANRSPQGTSSFLMYWNEQVFWSSGSGSSTNLQNFTFPLTAIAGNNTLRIQGFGTPDGVGVSLDKLSLKRAGQTANGGNMDIYQNVPNLAAGQVMKLQFNHANTTTAASGSFDVLWNDVVVAQYNSTNKAMVMESLNLTAIAGTNKLGFRGTGTVDALGAAIDNVRLFATTYDPHGGNMDISQTVSGLTAGQIMRLQFDHANRTSAASGSFDVFWNGVLVAQIAGTGTTMLTKSYDIVALAGNNTLRFVGTGTVDAAGASIDNVRLFATQDSPHGGNMDVSQAINGLTAGQTYRFQFDHANTTNAASGSFDVYWNTTRIAQITTTGTTMTPESYDVVAAAGANTIRFVGTGAVDAAGAAIDNVRLFATQVDVGGGNMDFYQDIPDLIAGQPMLLQFDHANRAVAGSGSFEVYWNGNLVAQVTSSGTTMVTDSIIVTAAAGNNVLRFLGTGTVDAVGASIDNVRLFAAQPASGGGGGGGAVDALAGLRPDTHSDDRYAWNIYDSASRLIETIDGSGAVTEFSYDGASRLVQTRSFAAQLAAGTVEAYKTVTPTAQVLPGSDPANDRVTRSFYDKEGLLIGTLDGEGYLTENIYDAADLLIETIRYATPTAGADRASGSFATLKAGVAGAATDKDVHEWYVYDGRGLLRGRINGEGDLTRYRYTAAGDVDQEVRGQKLSPAELTGTRPTFASLPTAAGGQVIETVNYTRDAMGRALSETRLLGDGGTWTTHYAYDPAGRLTSRTEAAGTTDARTLTQRFDARGNLVGELGGEGSAALAALGAAPAAAAVDGVYATWGTIYAYDPDGRLLSKTEANGVNAAGNRTTYFYRGDLLVFQVNAVGEITEFRYNARGERTDTILFSNRIAAGTLPHLTGGEMTAGGDAMANGLRNANFDSVSHVDYDATGRVRQSIDALSAVITYGYNAFGEVKTRTDPLDGPNTVQTDRLYDRRGLLLSEKRDSAAGGLQLETVYGYDAFGRPSQVTDAAGRVRKTDYDRAGRVALTTDARSATQSFGYDGRGNVISIKDRNDATATFTYDAFSRTTTSTTPGQITTTIKHNAHGDTVSIKDGALRETIYVYDKDGNLKSETDAAGNQAQHAYDSAGRRKETIDARGSKTSYTYDAASRVLTEKVDDGGLNLVTAYEYDAKGQRFKITDPALRVTEVKFDLAGRKTAVIEDSGRLNLLTEYEYDKSGRLLRVREAAGSSIARITQYEYDKADRLLQTRVDPAGLNLLTQYSYDKAGNVARKTDAANFVTTFAYDAENRLTRTLDPEGGVAETSYDNEGRISGTRRYANAGSAAAAAGGAFTISVAANGNDRLSAYFHDTDGRLRVSVDGSGRPTEYLHDGAGNVIRSVDYAGTIIPHPTGESLAVVEARIAGLAGLPDNRTTRAVYDSANRQVFGIDATGQVTAFAYDGSGNVTKQVRYANLFTAAHDPSAGEMHNWAAGNASSDDRVDRTFYDGASRATFSVDAENYVTQSQYDAAGRISKQIRHAGNGYSTADGTTEAGLSAQIGAPQGDAAVTAFTYDTAGRLTDTTDPENVVTHLVLDLLGQAIDTIVAHNVPGAASTTHREFDKAGRVKSETRAYGTADSTTIGYSYDGAGRVRFLTDGRQTVSEYVYDGLGRRTQEIQPLAAGQTASTHKEYDKFGNLVKLTDPRGNAALFHYDALDRLVWQTDPEGYVTQTAYTRGDEVSSVTRYAVAVGGTTTALPPAVQPNAADATTTFTRDKLDRLKAVTDAELHTEIYTLNAFGDRIAVKNKIDGTTTNTFDKRGLLKTETLPVGSTRADGVLVATNVVNKYDYDARGNLLTKTEALGIAGEQRITNFEYDRADRLKKKSGDSVYSVTSLATGAGAWTVPSETYAYDSRGNLIETATSWGARTLSYYDPLGRKTAEIGALGTLSTWTYDANGNVTGARVYGDPVALPATPGGAAPGPADAANYRETLYSYDLNNRLFETKIAGLRTGRYQGGEYVTGTGTVTLQNFYDGAGNLVREVDGNGESIYSFYDKAGGRIARVDQESYLTSYTLDGDGNVVTEERFSTKVAGVDASSSPAALKASVAGGAGNRVTNFTYDKNGRRKSEARLAVDARSLSATGALVQASGEAKIRYEYNGLGQVIQKIEANLDVTDFGYDLTGRLTSTESASFTDFENALVRARTEMSYNGLGLVTRAVDKGKAPAADRVTTYTYGAGGRLDQLKDAGGTTYAHYYDAAGNLVMQSYQRSNSMGDPTTYANAYRYDLLDRTTSSSTLTWKPAQGSWEESDRTQSRYNAFGEVSGKGVNAYQETFDYDNAGRLWRSNSGDGAWRYFVHDGAGNRTLAIEAEGDGAGLEGYALADAIALANLGSGYGDGVAGTIAVFDRRGQQISTIQPNRELSNLTGRVTLTSGRTYNAFGEVASETDARGATTDFVYNAMGRLTEKHSAPVSYTPVGGVPVHNIRAVEKYYYDISGRMIGLRDANSVQANGDENHAAITRSLLAGTGHDGAEALVTAEFHPDSGVFRTAYDIFRDARILTDELNEAETRAYDSMGRLTAQVHRGQLLSDHYEYDSLGQRIKHWNSHLGQSEAETTDYDVQGRVTRQKTFGLAATEYTYNWNSALTTGNVGAFGGWTKTTATGAISNTEEIDLFGRVLSRIDQNQRHYTSAYDRAGRLKTHSGPTGQSQTYSYFNTGKISTIVDAAGGGSSPGGHANLITATYGYDENGNRTAEKYAGTVWNYDYVNGHSQETTTFQDAAIGYDLLGRITSFVDQGGARTFHTEFDLAGNVRVSREKYNDIASGFGEVNTEKWFAYDSMNRMVVANGVLLNGTVHRGDAGVDLTYDFAGRRRTVTHQQQLMGTAKRMVWVRNDDGGGHNYEDVMPEGDPGPGWTQVEETYDSEYSGARREDYHYRADGYLMTVQFADENFDGSGSSAAPNGVMRSPVDRGVNTRDSMGRVTSYVERNDRGLYSYNRFDVEYDAASRVTDEVTSSSKWEQGVNGAQGTYATYRSETHNDYFGPGGAVSSTFVRNFRNDLDHEAVDSSTTYDHELWDEAKVKTITLDGVATSTHYYDGLGRLASVDIGARRHAVSFATAPGGQVLRRLEQSPHPYDPVDHYFYVDGQQVGELTNNGDHDPTRDDYSGTISTREKKASTSDYPFRWNSYGPKTGAQFGGSGYDPVSPHSNGMQGHDERYAVREGDTLASIAQQVWGDSALWYMIAEANGLTGAEALVAGTSLIIPDKVTNHHNNGSTFQVYDPNKAFGDLNPTTATVTSAKPAKKSNKCGVFGMILLVVVAVAVSVVTYGALAPQAAGFLTTVAAGAASGVAGSVASQAFGVATGIQEKFSWKQVAMAGISGAVSGGVGHLLGQAGVAGSRILTGVVRGAASSAVTQGVAVATGLQKKFDWAGIAVAGIVSGATVAISKALPNSAKPAQYARDGSLLQRATPASAVNSAASALGGAIAGAGARSILTGTSFGDNLLAVLPDVIGSTIGNMVGGAISKAVRPRPDEKEALLAPEARARLAHGIVELPDGQFRATLLDGTVITGSVQEVHAAITEQARAHMPPADRAVRSGSDNGAAATDGAAAGPTEFRYGDVFIPAAAPGGTGLLYQYVGQNFVTGYAGAMAWGEYAEYYSGSSVGAALATELSLSPEATVAFAQMAEISAYLVGTHPTRQEALMSVADSLFAAHWDMTEPARAMFSPGDGNLFGNNSLSSASWASSFDFSASGGSAHRGDGSYVTSARSGFGGWLDNMRGAAGYYGAQALHQVAGSFFRNPSGMGLASGVVEGLGGLGVNLVAEGSRPLLPDTDDIYSAATRRQIAASNPLGLNLAPSNADKRQMLGNIVVGLSTARIPVGLGRVGAAEGQAARVTAFRVEGIPNARFDVDGLGNVALRPGDRTIWLNFGQEARATSYFDRKVADGLPGARLTSFEMDRRFLDEIRATAVPENLARRNPGAPIISRDPYPDQFGIRPEQFDKMMQSIHQGSGRNVRGR